LADARAAVLGAVRGVEIADLDAVAADPDLEVIARHGRVGEHEIVVGVRADHRRALVEHVLLAGIGPRHDVQPKAALEQDAAGVVGQELGVDLAHYRSVVPRRRIRNQATNTPSTPPGRSRPPSQQPPPGPASAAPPSGPASRPPDAPSPGTPPSS